MNPADLQLSDTVDALKAMVLGWEISSLIG
jgi:hypothetical protein